MSDFFVVRIKRIRNDERLIFDGVETFSFALKKDGLTLHAHKKRAFVGVVLRALCERVVYNNNNNGRRIGDDDDEEEDKIDVE